jgi:hypothetical protein
MVYTTAFLAALSEMEMHTLSAILEHTLTCFSVYRRHGDEHDLHSVEPSLSAIKGLVQKVHAVFARPDEYDPNGHITQAVNPAVEFVYLPGWHCTHDVLPVVVDSYPARQLAHGPVLPTEVEYVPSAHGKQLASPVVLENDPGRHCVHCVTPLWLA